jgi:hypothetical protein
MSARRYPRRVDKLNPASCCLARDLAQPARCWKCRRTSPELIPSRRRVSSDLWRSPCSQTLSTGSTSSTPFLRFVPASCDSRARIEMRCWGRTAECCGGVRMLLERTRSTQMDRSARRFLIVVDSSIVKVCATPLVIVYGHALIGWESSEQNVVITCCL